MEYFLAVFDLICLHLSCSYENMFANTIAVLMYLAYTQSSFMLLFFFASVSGKQYSKRERRMNNCTCIPVQFYHSTGIGFSWNHNFCNTLNSI